jgi:diacylglycerol kinase (ATP)
LARLFFIYNPVASDGRSAERIARVRENLGSSYSWFATDGPGDAAHLARQIAINGADTIVAVGGDGTVHEVVNGIMSVAAKHRPALGILPVGTGNDFAFGTGVSSDLATATKQLLRGATTSVDVGTIEDDKARRIYWSNTVGIGLNAKIAIRARRYQALKGSSKYVAATLSSIFRDMSPFEVDLTIDHHKLSEQICMLTIGNGKREGGKFYVTPEADLRDNKLDLAMFRPMNRFESLLVMPQILKGRHLRSSKVFYTKFSTMQLRCKTPLVIHADGEIFARPADNVKELTIQVHSRALRVIA